jgi:hypothetical protein
MCIDSSESCVSKIIKTGSMTTEELLRDRYRVIADYPQPPYNVDDDERKLIKGDVLLYMRVNCIMTYRRIGKYRHLSVGVPCVSHPEKYPDVFRKLEWWEEREPEDMPEYIKYENMVSMVVGLDPGEPLRQVKYNGVGRFHLDNQYQLKGFSWSEVLPATKDEYEAVNK